MFGIGSRCFYAKYKGMIFEFAYKRDRDYFVDVNEEAELILAVDAWKQYVPKKGFIRVWPSCCLGANKERKERINNWYDNKRCNFQ